MTDTSPLPLSPADLVRTHQAGVWRYLRYLGCDRELAGDLTQETFLAVFRKPFEQRSPQATAAYLRTVARHKFVRAMLRRRRSIERSELEVAESVWAAAYPHGDGGAYLEALDECLGRLADRARKAIERRYRDGRSREEIAAEMEMTADGVKTLLRRARDQLRQCVQRIVRTDGKP